MERLRCIQLASARKERAEKAIRARVERALEWRLAHCAVRRGPAAAAAASSSAAAPAAPDTATAAAASATATAATPASACAAAATAAAVSSAGAAAAASSAAAAPAAVPSATFRCRLPPVLRVIDLTSDAEEGSTDTLLDSSVSDA